MFKDKNEFIKQFSQRVVETYGTTVPYTHPTERFMVLGDMVRDYASIHWKDTKTEVEKKHLKKVYYFSMEFLLGRSLKNNLISLGIYDLVEEGLQALNIRLSDLLEIESDAGLGNGGLGRLAACFMDSAATLNYPVNGNCLRYQYGLFRQEINENGEQVELPDMWMRVGHPWEIRKPKLGVDVSFWGGVTVTGDQEGNLHFERVNDIKVRAVPYDVPMIGRDTKMTNTLRLWSAEPADGSLPAGDYRHYLSEVNEICLNVYPDDSSEAGRYLRLKQQYFLVAAGLHTITEDHLKTYGTLDSLADQVVIQLNDTHPVLAIPELMRILMDEHRYSWQKAWKIVSGVMAYTNHTILSEALEVWPCVYLERLLPRIYMIIQEIDRRFYAEAIEHHSEALVQSCRIIDHQMVHMARLAVVGSFSVNGVARLHTEILKNDVFANFHTLFPDKLNNKTNGITPRRWMYDANPELKDFLCHTIGPRFLKDAGYLEDLLRYADDHEVRNGFLEVKRKRKEILARYIQDTVHVTVSPDSIFDVQAKRLHAYKRQLLNILQVIARYQELIAHPETEMPDRTWIFAAKAAPSYLFAKKVIQLINCVADKVNHDPRAQGKIKVVFLPDYRVTMSEILVGATDVSEQISTAGKEASGTGNMKFMMNGAITLGTLDGANVEIDQLVGRENDVIFGLTVEEIPLFAQSYRAWEYLRNDPVLAKAVESLIDGTWNENKDCFRLIYDDLLNHNDEYFVLADFAAYRNAQKEIERMYADRSGWAGSCLVNIARSGYFSSDRTIREYAQQIWHIEPLEFTE